MAASTYNLEAVRIDLSKATSVDNEQQIDYFKVLGRHNLLGEDLETDANSLNKEFYEELLYLLGLKEIKDGDTRVIVAAKEGGALIDSIVSKIDKRNGFDDRWCIEAYGTNGSLRAFRIALELALTWVNRLLFLKLLEGQLIRFHGVDGSYAFLNRAHIKSFDDLSDLFFEVLAEPAGNRKPQIQAMYSRIPYLNSSLFERSRVETIFGVDSLSGQGQIVYYRKTAIKDHTGKKRTGATSLLSYLLEFLNSYDFGQTTEGELRESRRMLINASVLGLIFEKINGHRDGAVFTPSFVTMDMSKVAIESAVLASFRAKRPGVSFDSIHHLSNYLGTRFHPKQVLEDNEVIDSLRVCDPAVGSGHFLVSCLNELLALKSRLFLLADNQGIRIADYEISVENDELQVIDRQTGNPFVYQVDNHNKASLNVARLQKTIFHEKLKLIERCLFGVDINPNSVRICQLRLWIELLKSAYYKDDQTLETLPNIDVNILTGNSLLSRSDRDTSLSSSFRRAGITVTKYRQLLTDYRQARAREAKRAIKKQIDEIREKLRRGAENPAIKSTELAILQLQTKMQQRELLNQSERATSKQEKEDRERLETLQVRLRALRNELAYRDAFEWRYEFPDVLNNNGAFEGFDVVIANPPYMRIQQIAATQPDQKPIYEAKYRMAAGSYDLANLFVELASKITKSERGGVHFIFPHKMFTSEHGRPLREWLIINKGLRSVTHFGANQIFGGVTTYTCIMHLETSSEETAVPKSFRFKRLAPTTDIASDLEKTPFSELAYRDITDAAKLHGTDRWIFFSSPQEADAFRKIYEKSCLAKDLLTVAVGLQTSLDPLYVVKAVEDRGDMWLVETNPGRKIGKIAVPTEHVLVEKAFFRPFLLGRNVRRYLDPKAQRLVFFPYIVSGESYELVSSVRLRSRYPLTWAFVEQFEKQFDKRENGKARLQSEFYDYIYPKNIVSFDHTKLVAMEIISHYPNVTIDKEGYAHTTKVYNVRIKGGQQSLLFYEGIFNSKLFWWFLKITGDTLRGDARTFKTDYVNQFPFPANVRKIQSDRIVSLSTRLSRKYNAQDVQPAEIIEVERDMNQAVYDLYGLTLEQRVAVENACGADRILTSGESLVADPSEEEEDE